MEYFSLTNAAKKLKKSRQAVYKELQRKNLLDKCDKLLGPTGKVSTLLIPASLLKQLTQHSEE